MQLPQVNLNGTAKADLSKQYEAAYDALQTAHCTFLLAAPHARDYQTLPPECYARARDEYTQRLEALESALGYIAVLALHVAAD